MWNDALKCVTAIAILLFAATAANTAVEQDHHATPAGGEIVVHLKGGLLLGTRVKPGADPDSRPHDDAAWEIASAVVVAGGAYIQIDWRQSDKVRDELLWWRLPRHGDARQVQAEVTGTLTFKPAKEIEGCTTDPAGMTPDTPVPLLNVKSLLVQLVGHDGRLAGRQPRTNRVFVD